MALKKKLKKLIHEKSRIQHLFANIWGQELMKLVKTR